jgi:hypothetical protein
MISCRTSDGVNSIERKVGCHHHESGKIPLICFEVLS